MLSARDVKGVMAMMPSFTTADGGSIKSKNTIEVNELGRAVDRIINDGIGVLTTTGSFGECYTLFPDEIRTIFTATVEAVAKRVPLFLGCTATHTREVLQRMEMAQEAGGDGVLVGVPYYGESTVDNAVQFYLDIAESFPDLAIMIYHNPVNHKFTIPVSMFERLKEKPNIIAMKDSHHEPLSFMRLMTITEGNLSVFTNQLQLYPYMMLGAAGCWSINAWMGPWPVVRAYEAAAKEDWQTVKELVMAMSDAQGGGGRERSREDGAGKLALSEAGYCDPGPNRPPFRILSDTAKARAKAQGLRWRALCETFPEAKYPEPATAI